jgi:hypothetical protein
MGNRRYVYSLLVGKLVGMKPLGRSWHRWEDNSRMIFNSWDGEAWTGWMWFRIETGGWQF